MHDSEREALFHFMMATIPPTKAGKPDQKNRTITWAEYAADVPGTAFPEEPGPSSVFYNHQANLNYLGGCPDSLLRHSAGVVGVTTSMLYVGQFGTVFCYHTED